MTCQYLIGELSVRLQQLQALADAAAAPEVARLLAEVEASPLGALAAVSARALALTDDLCWQSLSRGDIGAFDAQARILAELGQFAAGARLLSPQ
jgi:hypothetical protein